MTVAWFTIEGIGGLVQCHRVDDSVSKAFARITRTDLVIVDDIGLLPVSADAAEGFYRLVDAAYERKSLSCWFGPWRAAPSGPAASGPVRAGSRLGRKATCRTRAAPLATATYRTPRTPQR